MSSNNRQLLANMSSPSKTKSITHSDTIGLTDDRPPVENPSTGTHSCDGKVTRSSTCNDPVLINSTSSTSGRIDDNRNVTKKVS